MSELEITGFDGDERRKLDGGSGLNGEMSNEFDSELGLGVSKAEFGGNSSGFLDGIMSNGGGGGGDVSNGGMNSNHFGLEMGFDGLKVGSEVISGTGGYRNGELNNVLKAAEMGFNGGLKSEYMSGGVGCRNGDAFRGEFGGGFMNDDVINGGGGGNQHRRSLSDVELLNGEMMMGNGGFGGGGWRTKICVHYRKGFCKKGDGCSFMHCNGGDEIGLMRELQLGRLNGGMGLGNKVMYGGLGLANERKDVGLLL